MNDCIDEIEAVPGLPEELPRGETILWQGAPDWRLVARNTFHLRLLAAYFLVLLGLRAVLAIWSGAAIWVVMQSVMIMALPGLLVGGVFTMGAWLIASTTMYTVTSKRLVMRFGLALPLCINLPFAHIQAAAVRCFADGFGDIPLTVDSSHRFSYVVMWPHARPWQWRRPQPMLRGIAEARAVAELIANAASASLPATEHHDFNPTADAVQNEAHLTTVAAGEMA